MMLSEQEIVGVIDTRVEVDAALAAGNGCGCSSHGLKFNSLKGHRLVRIEVSVMISASQPTALQLLSVWQRYLNPMVTARTCTN